MPGARGTGVGCGGQVAVAAVVVVVKGVAVAYMVPIFMVVGKVVFMVKELRGRIRRVI